MLKASVFLPIAALAVAACGQLDSNAAKTTMIENCVGSGQDKAFCTCVVDETEKSADPEVFKAMLLDAQGKVEEAQKIMEALPKAKQFESAMVRPASLSR
jgi:hypothetical protein